jgi:hypothetical protein
METIDITEFNFQKEQEKQADLVKNINNLLKIARSTETTEEQKKEATSELGTMLANKTLAVVLYSQRETEKMKTKDLAHKLEDTEGKLEDLGSFFKTLLPLLDSLLLADDKGWGLLEPIVGFFRQKPTQFEVYKQLGLLALGRGKFSNIRLLVNNAKKMFDEDKFEPLVVKAKKLKSLKGYIDSPVYEKILKLK